MRYQPLSSEVYKHHRARLGACMDANSAIVFLSNDVMPLNADTAYPYRQNSDLFYFTGLEQPETYLIVQKNSNDIESWLFTEKPDPVTTIWVGKKHTKSEAAKISGVDQVLWNDSYEQKLRKVLSNTKTLYIPSNPNSVNSKIISPTQRLKSWCEVEFPKVTIKDETFPQLRLIKSEEEIEQLKQAVAITESGFRKVLQHMRPGMKEYEVEALLAGEFIAQGSRGFAYEPIVACGANACILHYTRNDLTCRTEDLVLLDVGAEYGGYAADLTRTIPVNGKFTKRQKQVYKAVHYVQKKAISMLSAGLQISEYNDLVALEMETQLLDLGLISPSSVRKQTKKTPAYREYFMHGISHQLGLDVHDVGGKVYDRFKENMVITVEPGIYIKEEKMGIRLENDVVIRKDGCEDLMKSTPIEIEEIESLMNA